MSSPLKGEKLPALETASGVRFPHVAVGAPGQRPLFPGLPLPWRAAAPAPAPTDLVEQLRAELAVAKAEQADLQRQLARDDIRAAADAARAELVDLQRQLHTTKAESGAAAAIPPPVAASSSSSSSSSSSGRDEMRAGKLLRDEEKEHEDRMENLTRHFARVVTRSSLIDYVDGDDNEFKSNPLVVDAAAEAASKAVKEAAVAAANPPDPHATVPEPTRFSKEFEFDTDDDDDDDANPAAIQPVDGAYGSGGGVFASSQVAAQASRFVAPDTVTDLTLRYLGSFIDRVCVTMGISEADTNQAMDWSDRAFRTRQWADSYQAVEGIGYNDEDTLSRIKQRLAIKQDFEREALQRFGTIRYAVTSALFWIQNRQGHTSLRLWDIIQSETWCVWFLDLVSILHSVNGPAVRTAWQIKALRSRYRELEAWFEQNHDFGPPPLIPGGYYKFQLRPPFARTTVAATNAEHVHDIRLLIQQATGDVDLTTEQAEHLVHTAMTKYFTGMSLKSLLRRTHSKIVFTQLLAMIHALSDTIIHNKRLHKRKMGKALPTAHMTVFLAQQCSMRIQWLRNFNVHGCACVA